MQHHEIFHHPRIDSFKVLSMNISSHTLSIRIKYQKYEGLYDNQLICHIKVKINKRYLLRYRKKNGLQKK